ncbi:polyphosphate kinase 2 [Ilumatobacter nonamiensis]|uniref:polyphosphate kinase 2 n=1 Tax=Ilumatobacter nonamiensis TaxID=467093 RepID=UPI00058F8FE1
MTAEEIRSQGFTVDGTFDEMDDPVLIGPDGLPLKTWQEGYPYEERMTREEYERDKRALQIELLKAQDWIQDTGHKLVVVFEGRDAAGKGSTIKRFMEHLNPRGVDVVALAVPTAREQGEWFFQRYVRHLPSSGEIRFFDRSWYNRGGVEPVMGYCTPHEHEEFLRSVPEFERMVIESGTTLIKLWFSVSRSEQITRFTIRRVDPVRQWKLSPTDIASLDRWDDYTAVKSQMFQRTSSPHAPWTVVRSNDKKRGRVNAMRHVLHSLPYEGKDTEIVHPPDPMIVGSPTWIEAEHGETTA